MAFSRPKKKKEVQHAPGTFEAEKNKRSKASRWAIGIFAVLMALLMMVPSLSLLVGGHHDQSQSIKTVADVDKLYQPREKEIEQKVKSNPKDLQAQLALAENYLNWGNYAKGLSTSDADKAHVKDLFNKALAAYDQGISGAKAAQSATDQFEVGKALTYFYDGTSTSEKTQASLKEIATREKSSFAWFVLGNMYGMNSDYKAARSAYESAASADTKGEKEFKEAAQKRIQMIDELQKEEAAKKKSSSKSEGKKAESAPAKSEPAPAAKK